MQDLMKGKRGLIMGVANDHSIAWGIAKTLARAWRRARLHLSGRGAGQARQAAGASQLGVDTGAALRRRGHRQRRCGVRSAARQNGAGSIFWSTPSRFSDKNELKGRYADTTRENFSRTMLISCFSFTEACQARGRADAGTGGAMITLTFGGSMRVMPNYNVMGVAKAALEASVRYLAADFGRAASASTRFRPARSARSPAPASAMRARCSPSSRSIRRSAAA